MSNSVQAIKLSFFSGLHIGRGAQELDKTATIYSSDALKSALFATGLSYYPQWAENPDAFFKGFCISSAFPWADDELFLPKPRNIRFQFESNNDITEAKQAKKIAYVSASVFRHWSAEPDHPVLVKESQIKGDAFLFAAKSKTFLHTSIQQRVQVPTEGSGDSRPYYFERLLFEGNSGLYFFISFQDEDLKPQILHVLNLLGDMGIGTDRTVGNGQFEIEAIEPFIMPSGSRGVQMALGLYLPSRDEIGLIDLEKSYWTLVKRGGYIAAADKEENRSLRKNNIYFFGEGSTFNAALVLRGRLADLQPTVTHTVLHPVWRCGMPLFFNL